MAHLTEQTKRLGEHHLLYALVDGAHEPFIHRRILLSGGTYRCLYRGHLSETVQEIAPYLVLLQSGRTTTEWIIEEGIPNHWASFFASVHDIDFLQRHFRKFLTVQREDGQKLYFRFYDPRVIPLIAETELLDALCKPGITFLTPKT
ncbi:DUF4123 domain-containing protein [Acanthopleuribacter pedis]|uniref:DUF4123 domain-containing protein n=2 Tax=Acanthopleuribacter pedis TaxID=442870 RepID=A0A8J7U4Q2_9BACT|nr:DUF4123 domain-containing protein [Acanthopleuribacter pedis]